ncbi:MAG: transcriptional repressor [Candidatus Micrarchaeota archaeon]
MKSRNTKQKETIGSVMERFDHFFTAEELCETVRKKDSKIGQATIYRFLKQEIKNSNLNNYVCGRKSVYSRGSNNHNHFTCERCGKKKHFSLKNIDFLQKEIGGKVKTVQIDIQGICEDCC